MRRRQLTLEKHESLPLHVRCVGDSEFTVQRGLSGDVVVGNQHADDHFVGGVFQTVDIDAGVDQRVAPENETRIQSKCTAATTTVARCLFRRPPTNEMVIRKANGHPLRNVSIVDFFFFFLKRKTWRLFMSPTNGVTYRLH